MTTVATREPVGSHRIEAALDLALQLQKTLLDAQPIASPLIDRLVPTIQTLPFPKQWMNHSNRIAFDKRGTALWNISSRAQWKGHLAQSLTIQCQIRTLSFFLLEGAQPSDGRKPDYLFRILRTALKAAQDCMNSDNILLTAKVLEQAALYENILTGSEESDSFARRDSYRYLPIEYFSLRLLLAHRQDRLDLAELLFSRIPRDRLVSAPQSAEALTQTLLDVGLRLQAERHNNTALAWLERAYTTLQGQDLSSLSADAGELRLNVLHSYVLSLLAVDESDAGFRAIEVMEILQKDYGHRLVVMLLKLKILDRDEQPDAKDYYANLMSVSRSMQLTEASIHVFMHHLHRLKIYDEGLAFKALSQILLQRLSASGCSSWIASSVLTLLWIGTTGEHLEFSAPAALLAVFNELLQQKIDIIDPEPCHGCFVLLWKQIDSVFKDQDYDRTLSWCKIAQSPLFEKAGDSNKAKVQRKMILCYLERKDHTNAMAMLHSMSQHETRKPLGQYLSFRVAILAKDEEIAQRSFEAVCAVSHDEPRYLLGCISEALLLQDRRLAIKLIGQAAQSGLSHMVHEINYPTLLRCAVKMLVAEITDHTGFEALLVDQLCRISEEAAKNVSRLPDLPISEREWFSRNSYNVALRFCMEWPPSFINRLLDVSISMHALNTQDLGPDLSSTYTKRSMLCHFIATNLALCEARRASVPGEKLKSYLAVKTAFEQFQRAYCAHFAESKVDGGSCLQQKFHTLVPFVFEAVIFTKDQAEDCATELSSLIDLANRYRAPTKTYLTFADLIFSTQAFLAQGMDGVSTKALMANQAGRLICKLIEAIRSYSGYSVVSASRWIRCIVHVVLNGMKEANSTDGVLDSDWHNSVQSGLSIVESLAHQATLLGRDSYTLLSTSQTDPSEQPQDEDTVYPPVELEHLSTTLFNSAIDFYVMERDKPAIRLAGLALKIATVLENAAAVKEREAHRGHKRISIEGLEGAGALAETLRVRMKELGWDAD